MLHTVRIGPRVLTMIDAVSKATIELIQFIGCVRWVQLGGMQHNRFVAWSCAQLVQTSSNRSRVYVVLVVSFASLQDRNIAKAGPICTEVHGTQISPRTSAFYWPRCTGSARILA